MHYCGNQLAAISVIEKASCCCEEDTKDVKDDCCKDEVKQFKIQDDQCKVESIVAFSTFNEAQLSELFHFNYLPKSKILLSKNIDLTARTVYEVQRIPSYKLNHSFLFYS
jgi:hypothetical protein